MVMMVGLPAATAHDLYRIIGNIDVCIKNDLFEVNVPLISCAVGVAPPRTDVIIDRLTSSHFPI
jgi:hypothetical protein